MELVDLKLHQKGSPELLRDSNLVNDSMRRGLLEFLPQGKLISGWKMLFFDRMIRRKTILVGSFDSEISSFLFIGVEITPKNGWDGSLAKPPCLSLTDGKLADQF